MEKELVEPISRCTCLGRGEEKGAGMQTRETRRNVRWIPRAKEDAPTLGKFGDMYTPPPLPRKA